MYNPPKGSRDIFVVWIRPGVDIIEKGKKTAFLGEVQKLLQPFDDDIETKVRNIVIIIASIPPCSDLGLVRQSDRFIYYQTMGNLFFDTDGIGKAAQV
ncbi:MAG: hypothetical protein V7K26_10460 [Nostoc sp.]|uniref:hypothetical protein n=1 Tax=Nostoc sp. TaxID=1180 RepID=UPI002FF23414